MKACPLLLLSVALVSFFSHLSGASQADDSMITITGQTAGATPFLAQLTLTTSDTTVIASIQFTITPKPGSVTRPLSGTYSNDYLMGRGDILPPTIFVPIYGLYEDYSNTVTLTYRFLDGSSKQVTTTVATNNFDDPCEYDMPMILQTRSNSTDLSYDYMMAKGSCDTFEPVIIDTDGALRWVGNAGISFGSFIFFDNAAYVAHMNQLSRLDLDGTVTLLAEYGDIGVTNFHHNIDRGKVGIILDANTTTYFNSTNIEVDASGKVVKEWSLGDIISAAMIAGGDDPSQFVHPTPTDWFHNNGTAYNRADDSLIVSSRENFLICLDYETGAIKWILGDPTKKWFEFPSLAQYALTIAPGSLPPIGQHSPSITYDQNLMVFDNGTPSVVQVPIGARRGYASPRKYSLDLAGKVATEVWNFPMNESIYDPYCSSVYEDAPNNYQIDYSIVNGGLGNVPVYAELLGLNAAGETIFYYQYPAEDCGKIYRSMPIHLENTKFPTVGPQALNLSTRGFVSAGDDALIGGFIITGTDPKTIVLRALGPSLSDSGLSGVLANPVLDIYDSAGALVATNDNWQSDPNHAVVASSGLAPVSPLESASAQTLAPGAYTVKVSGKNPAPGIGLVELYDLSPSSNSKLANISTRGSIGNGDDVLISGFIVGDVGSATVIVRGLGPSLAFSGLGNVLADPSLTIYDTNGSMIASNDDWQDDINSPDVQKNNLAPSDAAESAIVLRLPAGAYSAIASGSDGGTGIGLVEVFDLD